MGGNDNGEGCVCMGAEDVWEISVPSTPFCCEFKTALKRQSLLKRKKKEKKRTKGLKVFNISILKNDFPCTARYKISQYMRK